VNDTFSHMLLQVHGPDGKLKYSAAHRHNLTTDTATGYTNRRDWQSKAMGGEGSGAFFTNASGSATAASATTLTKATASFPTAGQGLAGRIVAFGPNTSGVGAWGFGVIVSNTATVLTVDQWYDAATITNTGSPLPNSTATFVILPGQFPANHLAVTANAVAPSSADTTLTAEITTSDLKRSLAVFSHTAAASTYSLTKVFSATTSVTINKGATFASAVAGNGAMPFETAEPSPPTLISGDQLTQISTITIN
jgi:hypothetical protein